MKLTFKVDRKKWDQKRADLRALQSLPTTVEWGPFRGTLEYGSTDGRIPPRPHARPALKRGQPRFAALVGGWHRRNGSSKDLRQVLKRIGAEGVELIREQIDSYTPPPNAPSTVKRKGFDFPLIETGEYRAALRFRLVNK